MSFTNFLKISTFALLLHIWHRVPHRTELNKLIRTTAEKELHLPKST